DAHCCASLGSVGTQWGLFSEATACNHKQRTVFLNDIHACDAVVIKETDGLHTRGLSSHGTDLAFVETQGLPMFSNKDHLVITTCEARPAKLITFIQGYGDQTRWADRGKLL